MSGKALSALLVRFENRPIGLRLIRCQPRQKSRAKIETDTGVVVCNLLDVLVTVQNTRRAVWGITFGSDALVPVMKWISRVLQFDELEPRVLSRRLIKMPVNTNITFHQSRISFSKSNALYGCSAMPPLGA